MKKTGTMNKNGCPRTTCRARCLLKWHTYDVFLLDIVRDTRQNLGRGGRGRGRWTDRRTDPNQFFFAGGNGAGKRGGGGGGLV